MSRMGAILAAAAVTSIVLVALLAIAGINLVSSGVISINMQPTPTADPMAAQLQDRQAALDQAAGVMDKRQEDFALQAKTADVNIAQLKQAIADQAAKNEADQQALAQLQQQVAVENGIAAQLANAAAPLQQQEADYAAQIEAANQQILALKAQIAQMTGQQP